MKEVWSGADPLLAAHLREVLEDAGIRTLLRNEYLSGGAGELPPTETWPQLLVLEDDDAERAGTLLAAALAPSAQRSPWRCARCGERHEAQFAACWRCGAEREVRTDT